MASEIVTMFTKPLVSITLESKNPSVAKWSTFLCSMCGNFWLLKHIKWHYNTIANQPCLGDEQSQCAKLALWLCHPRRPWSCYGAKSKPSALWTTIENLSQANKKPPTIFLSHKFHFMTQGDLPMSEYCQHVKILTQSLLDVDHTISNPQWVLLHGINKCFFNTTDIYISNTIPLPTFSTTRSIS